MFQRLAKLFTTNQSDTTGKNSSLPIHKIDFDMMLKGTLYERSNGKVRQCAVTVDGATKLVTSGDTVTQEIYQALIDYGAIAPTPKKQPEKNTKEE